jgi:hypothetical protein
VLGEDLALFGFMVLALDHVLAWVPVRTSKRASAGTSHRTQSRSAAVITYAGFPAMLWHLQLGRQALARAEGDPRGLMLIWFRTFNGSSIR